MKSKRVNLKIEFFLIALAVVVMIGFPLQADETLYEIHADSSFSYNKPEVKIHPSGDVYVSYTAVNGSGRSEVYLSKYSSSNEKISFVKNLSESGAQSYESEIDISSNGNIHVAWGDQSGNSCVIKYRMFNGSSWSGTVNLATLNNLTRIEDLRIAVDPSGNVFVVVNWWNNLNTGCRFISKYGNNISNESWPTNDRSKHADVAADRDYIHIVWQRKYDGDYTIAYQRRVNARNSNWESWINLNFEGTQRPRISLDKNNNPHVVFFRNFGSTRVLWYKRWNGSRFTDPERLSDKSNAETYHFCDVSAVDSDNVLVSMQRGGHGGGQFVGYNWKRSGQWSGYSHFSKSYPYRPAKQSIDVARDRFFAAVSFVNKDDGIYLILVEESGNPGGGEAPIAAFSFSPQTGNVPLTVSFDASGSTDTDGTIESYQWTFGDGGTGTGLKPSHTYNSEGNYTVNLTVTDNDGLTGTASKTLYAEPPNQPPEARFNFNPKVGLYPLTVNFNASGSVDHDGVIDSYDWVFGDEDIASGSIVTHTFTEKGHYTVTLTVYDDDGASATASEIVNVQGLLPPNNVNYEALINRNLFTIQHVYRVTWNRNPGNAARGANIIRYNIYRKRMMHHAYSLLTTVDAQDTNEHYDRIGTEKIEYQYAITGIDDQGRESELPLSWTSPVKSIKIPDNQAKNGK